MLEYFINKIIEAEVQHQQAQREYFAKREKVGDLVMPWIWQPVIESEATNLVAVFQEPGALHLVFRDEIAPFTDLDKRYRKVRQEVFGRTTDVESLEFDGKYVRFEGNFSIPNVYESSFHWTSAQDFKGDIFSDTWNHLTSTIGTVFDRARGGYRATQFEVHRGDRAAAESWVPRG